MIIFLDLFLVKYKKYNKSSYSESRIEKLLNDIVHEPLHELVINALYHKFFIIFLQVISHKSLFGYVFCNINKHTSLNTFIWPNISDTDLY